MAAQQQQASNTSSPMSTSTYETFNPFEDEKFHREEEKNDSEQVRERRISLEDKLADLSLTKRLSNLSKTLSKKVLMSPRNNPDELQGLGGQVGAKPSSTTATTSSGGGASDEEKEDDVYVSDAQVRAMRNMKKKRFSFRSTPRNGQADPHFQQALEIWTIAISLLFCILISGRVS